VFWQSDLAVRQQTLHNGIGFAAFNIFHLINQTIPVMNSRFFIPTLGLFILISLNLNAQPGIVIDSTVGQTGQIVCVPVRAKGFVEVITMQGSISWDTQVLEFDKVQNYYFSIGLTPTNFNSNPQGSHLLFSWADASASCLSVDDGEILFEVCFSVVGPAGSSSDVKIDTAIIETCPAGQNIWSSADSPPGHIEVTTAANASELAVSKQPTFTLSPNPTSSDAQVMFHSQQDGAATFFVSNTLGQTVFEQKASINIGENQIQIPAETLTTKGTYQVVLRTKQGAVSQLLIVY
jgi:hypothetical protein